MDSHITICPSTLYTGTPVVLISTLNADGTANLSPASSAWALGDMVVIGLENGGQTLSDLRARPELTINYPHGDMWESVESLGDLTGASPVPPHKEDRYRFESDKFGVSELTPQQSTSVKVPRVEECPLQLEAVVEKITDGVGDYAIVEARVTQVHAEESIVLPGTQHIDTRSWSPLLYAFKHYFSLGKHLGQRPGVA